VGAGDAAGADSPQRRPEWKVVRRTVVFPLQEISLRHERLNLPPMSPALIEKAVRQHCISAQPGAPDLEISYVADKGSKRPNDLLVVWTQREVVESKITALADDGYQVRHLVTPTVALIALLQATGYAGAAEGSTVLIHLGEQTASAACYTDGVLVLGREFALLRRPSPGDEAPDGSDPEHKSERIEHILDEISRSLLLFNHRLRGKRVARILLSSDHYPVEELVPLCQERFEVAAGLLIDEVDLDLSGFGEGLAAKEAAAPWILAIATAVAGLSEAPGINLFPTALAARQRRRMVVALATGTAMLLLLAMAMYHLSYFMTTSSIMDRLQAHVVLAEATDRAVDNLDELRLGRLQAGQQLEFLRQTQQPAAVLREVLQALSLAATDSLCIDETELHSAAHDGGRLTIMVRGRVTTSSSADAQAQFNLFYEHLKANSVLRHASVGPLEIESVTDGRRSVLNFELLAQMEQDGRRQ
jgi:hypothetical protein